VIIALKDYICTLTGTIKVALKDYICTLTGTIKVALKDYICILSDTIRVAVGIPLTELFAGRCRHRLLGYSYLLHHFSSPVKNTTEIIDVGVAQFG
jgi:hypothetical protein